MKLSKHKRQTTPDMNMTPMIDVVFLLIIFFMTVSQVSKINQERLDLPTAAGNEEQQPAMVTINVTQQERIIVSGNELTPTQLLTYIGDELFSVGDPSQLSIVLRADRRATSRTVNLIVRELAKLNINRVRIAVEVPSG